MARSASWLLAAALAAAALLAALAAPAAAAPDEGAAGGRRLHQVSAGKASSWNKIMDALAASMVMKAKAKYEVPAAQVRGRLGRRRFRATPPPRAQPVHSPQH
jgi:hypothetical protein